MRQCLLLVSITVLLAGSPPAGAAVSFNPLSANAPSVLVLYDGPENEANPGRVDALYLANLLGHFTTRRRILSLDEYRRGTWTSYDAIFCIVYQKRYTVPDAFLQDAPEISRPFCWLGNQVGQLNRHGVLSRHGLRFERFQEDVPFKRVLYKGATLDKGDSDTNLLTVTDSNRTHVVAWALAPSGQRTPYILQSGSFWIIADSPFSYSSESDRMLAFADVLHDILGIDHSEDHRALLRIEDINALSDPQQLKAILRTIHRHHIPFSFGFVPMYVNPAERIYLRLTDKPDVVDALKEYAQQGGVPVLHGFTHQHRGVTTDDYEFWDDLGDRPIQGDSEALVSRRVEQAVKESVEAGIFPVTWETPHYAASALDYRIFHRHFATVFERRLVSKSLGTDQLFPYPVIDLYGQYIIPEDLSYIPQGDPRVEPILRNAGAAHVVRDGYASVFFHPFLKPGLLDQLIDGVESQGYHFVDLRNFPNKVEVEGCVITTQNGEVTVSSHGRYLNETIWDSNGTLAHQTTFVVPEEGVLSHRVSIAPGQTAVLLRQTARPPSWIEKLVHLAKGDLSVAERKWETVFPWRNWHDPLKTVILWNPAAHGEEATDQQSFSNALYNIGYDIERVDSEDFLENELGPFTLLVIPWSTARSLPPEKVDKILGALKGGITLVTDGESPLSKALGVQLSEPLPIDSIVNHLFTGEYYHWADHPRVPTIVSPAGTDVTTYYSDRDNHPLVMKGSWGQGKYLYFAPLYDPRSGLGYSRFPDLPSILLREFNLTPLLKRQEADAYFDPGYRQSISIERLAALWRRFGIRTVHVAAWHFYDKYTYDYARLIRVAHQNGILVDAWFEWPHVSERFWNRHPEWREKTALLTDARVDWRYLMNFQNPACLKAVLEDMKVFLRQNDWDGIDLAELGFESAQGPEAPQFLTPFNPQARKDFQNQYGFDPMELFRRGSAWNWKTNPGALQHFYDYRRRIRIKLLETILDAFTSLNREKGHSWEIILTVIDTLQHPELSDTLGIDMPGTLKMLNRYGAILQVEDPASEWSKSPDRYLRLGERYRSLLSGQPFMIDINVLPVHSMAQKDFATAQPTGSELLTLWKAASSQSGRVCLYSEASIHEQDWEALPYAMAADANVSKEGNSWVVRSPHTVVLELGRGTRKYKLDGDPWPCVDKGEVIIPPGEHSLTFSLTRQSWVDTEQLETRLISISGELLGCQEKARGLEVEYISSGRCLMRFNKFPSGISMDGVSSRLPVLRGDDGFTVIGPPGQHRIRIVSQSAFLYIVEFMSVVSASLIVLFGMASSSLLAVLFLFITFHRRMRKIRRFVLGQAR